MNGLTKCTAYQELARAFSLIKTAYSQQKDFSNRHFIREGIDITHKSKTVIMSWRVISNSNILRVNSINYANLAKTSSPQAQENFAPELLEYMNSIFTALDLGQTGYVSVDDLEKYWKLNGQGNDLWLKSHYAIESSNVVAFMRQITPGNGIFDFRRFIRGMKMAVSRAKEDRLKKLSSGKLKIAERSKSFGKQQTVVQPLAKLPPTSKRSTSSASQRGIGISKASRRPMREVQTSCSGFGLLADEESINEVKELPKPLEPSKQRVAPKVMPKPRGLFKKFEDSYNDTMTSSEWHSLISQCETVDYSSANESRDQIVPKCREMSYNLRETTLNSRESSFKAKGSKNGASMMKLKEMAKGGQKRSENSQQRVYRKTELGKVIDEASEKIRLMQKCVDATENAREWYTRKIAALQQDRMEVRRLVFVSRDKDDTQSRVDELKRNWQSTTYDDINRYMGTVSYYTDQLKGVGARQNKIEGDVTTPTKSTPQKLALENKIKAQARIIQQLESEKSSLVKDVFQLKGKINIVQKPTDQVVPF